MKLYEILRRRSELFLIEAEEDLRRGFYDLAAFHAEQALQLFLKSMIVSMSGEEVRGHGIRELLAMLTLSLEEEGLEQALTLKEVARKYRRELIELEEAYYQVRYKPVLYDKEEAERLVKVSKEIMELLKKVEGELWPSL